MMIGLTLSAFPFRQLYRGADVLDELEKQETYNQRPVNECKIASCGLYDEEKL